METNRTVGGLFGYSSVNSIVSLKVPMTSRKIIINEAKSFARCKQKNNTIPNRCTQLQSGMYKRLPTILFRTQSSILTQAVNVVCFVLFFKERNDFYLERKGQ